MRQGGVIWCEYGNLMRASVFIFLAVFSAPFFSLIFSSAFFLAFDEVENLLTSQKGRKLL